MLPSSELHAFTLAELRDSPRGVSKSHFIGECGFGPVYKGFLDDRLWPGEIEPQHVAVKHFDPDRPQGHRGCLVEASASGEADRLLLPGRQDEQRMLVYEYMARGSIEHHLLKSALSSLPWSVRLKIAVVTA